jgi:hypothetical protein
MEGFHTLFLFSTRAGSCSCCREWLPSGLVLVVEYKARRYDTREAGVLGRAWESGLEGYVTYKVSEEESEALPGVYTFCHFPTRATPIGFLTIPGLFLPWTSHASQSEQAMEHASSRGGGNSTSWIDAP